MLGISRFYFCFSTCWLRGFCSSGRWREWKDTTTHSLYNFLLFLGIPSECILTLSTSSTCRHTFECVRGSSCWGWRRWRRWRLLHSGHSPVASSTAHLAGPREKASRCPLWRRTASTPPRIANRSSWYWAAAVAHCPWFRPALRSYRRWIYCSSTDFACLFACGYTLLAHLHQPTRRHGERCFFRLCFGYDCAVGFICWAVQFSWAEGLLFCVL